MTNIMKNNTEDFSKLCELLCDQIGFDVETLVPIGCDGTLDKTRSILKEHFPQYNIEETIKYFESEGGYCDCEILLNVDKCECDCDEDGDCKCECCGNSDDD